MSDTNKETVKPGAKEKITTEKRHIVIYGYTREELKNIMRHFEAQLPDYVKIKIDTDNLVTNITLTGVNTGLELLRFKMNKFQQSLSAIFSEETITTENKSVSQVLGELLTERELTVSCAESCTGGNIAHKITQNSGSSGYFLGSVVSYSNDVKAKVLNVSRSDLGRFGAVSKQVAEEMVRGVADLMQTDCAMATTGIAGPDGGTPEKPVGTVFIGISRQGRCFAQEFHFRGKRPWIRTLACSNALNLLRLEML